MSNSPDSLRIPDEALLRQRQLIPNIIPWSSATLWRRIKAEQFPKPIKLDGGRMTAWRWGEVRAWLQAQGQERGA